MPFVHTVVYHHMYAIWGVIRIVIMPASAMTNAPKMIRDPRQRFCDTVVDIYIYFLALICAISSSFYKIYIRLDTYQFQIYKLFH